MRFLASVLGAFLASLTTLIGALKAPLLGAGFKAPAPPPAPRPAPRGRKAPRPFLYRPLGVITQRGLDRMSLAKAPRPRPAPREGSPPAPRIEVGGLQVGLMTPSFKKAFVFGLLVAVGVSVFLGFTIAEHLEATLYSSAGVWAINSLSSYQRTEYARLMLRICDEVDSAILYGAKDIRKEVCEAFDISDYKLREAWGYLSEAIRAQHIAATITDPLEYSENFDLISTLAEDALRHACLAGDIDLPPQKEAKAPTNEDSYYLGYDKFVDEEGKEYGSFEVVHLDGNDVEIMNQGLEDSGLYEDSEEYTAGFYWASCFPGCLPDGDHMGPFNTAKEAYLDARGEI